MRHSYLSLALVLCSLGATSWSQEIPADPKVQSVSLFKNGLCMVRSTFNAGAAGTYLWNDPARAVHATFMAESDGDISLRSVERIVEEAGEEDRPTGNLQRDLAGLDVRLTLRSVQGVPGREVAGRVWAMPTPKPRGREWSSGTIEGDQFGNRMRSAEEVAPTTGNFLVIESGEERVYVDSGSIMMLEVTGKLAKAKRFVRKPVMLLQVAKPGPVRISYLSRGASWVPNYFVDLTDPKQLSLRQTALIRNELGSWKGVEMNLISGFPNIQFSHVDSPLWAGTNLAAFFQQISAVPGRFGGMLAYQSVGSSRAGERVPKMPTVGAGLGEDLHFENIGLRDLEAGETLAVDVAKTKAEYERVIEWTVEDPRNEYGQSIRSDRETQTDADAAWDAVLFENPLKFAMTTAAATIMEKGQIRGQSLSSWANPGQRTCLRITRALSVQTDHQEVEEQGARETVKRGGYEYYRARVKGTLTLRNFRPEAATIYARAQFSGELIEADENPGQTLRKEGAYWANPRNELEWKFSVPAGGEKKLNYRYTVLVRN